MPLFQLNVKYVKNIFNCKSNIKKNITIRKAKKTALNAEIKALFPNES